MTTHIYDDALRNDPARRAAVQTQIEERQAVFAKAQALIAEAAALMRGLGPVEDDALVARCAKTASLASIRFNSDARFIMAEPNETYIGNQAAAGSPVGWTPPTSTDQPTTVVR